MLKNIIQLIMHLIVAFPVADNEILNMLFSKSLIIFPNVFRRINKKTFFSLLTFSAHDDISIFWLMWTSYEVSRRGFWSINKWGQQRGGFDWNLFSTSAYLFCSSVFMLLVPVSTSLSFSSSSSSSQRSLKQSEI